MSKANCVKLLWISRSININADFGRNRPLVSIVCIRCATDCKVLFIKNLDISLTNSEYVLLCFRLILIMASSWKHQTMPNWFSYLQSSTQHKVNVRGKFNCSENLYGVKFYWVDPNSIAINCIALHTHSKQLTRLMVYRYHIIILRNLCFRNIIFHIVRLINQLLLKWNSANGTRSQITEICTHLRLMNIIFKIHIDSGFFESKTKFSIPVIRQSLLFWRNLIWNS